MKNELTAKRMQLALSNANMIPQELAEKSGVSKSSISQYVNGSHAPSNISSGKMGKVLGVNPLWLMGFDVDMKESIIEKSPEELRQEKFNQYEHIVDKYRFISTHSPDGASVVDTVLDREYSIACKLNEQEEQIKKMDMEVTKKIIPKRILAYYGKIAAAGKSYGFDDVIAGTIECPMTEESQRADYTIGISGNSMEPTFYDGDIVYVSKNANPGIGDIGIFQKDNGIYIKEVGENELISHNTEYKPMVNNGDILCLGKVIGKVEE